MFKGKVLVVVIVGMNIKVDMVVVEMRTNVIFDMVEGQCTLGPLKSTNS
jgi:hypothetical protein